MEPVGKKPDMSEGTCIVLRYRNYTMDQQQDKQFLAETHHTTMFVIWVSELLQSKVTMVFLEFRADYLGKWKYMLELW